MHARHRNQGHGLKSNSTGLGPASSGISEYRGFSSRGYGRGQITRHKSLQQIPKSSQKSDIIMEAGKLAAEYLVSKGSISPNALPTKWKNGSFSKQTADYPNEPFQESRASVHSRLGNNNGGLDSRKRYSNDFTPRHQPRTRRRGGPSRNHASEWSKDHGINGPDRSRVSSDLEAEDDSVSDLDNFDSNGKLTPTLTDKKSEEITNIDSQSEEFFVPREAAYLKEFLETKENEDQKHEDNLTDLAKLCRFSKVPTKTRSALSLKPSNSEVEDDINEQVQHNPANDQSTSESNTEDIKAVPEKSLENPSDGKEMKLDEVVPKFARSGSCPSKPYLEETRQSLERSNSVKERGERRKSSSADLSEIIEKQREWLSPFEKGGDHPIQQNEEKINSTNATVPPSLENVVENYDLTNSAIEGSPKVSEEKQLFPNSFKICDLNLIEASHVNDIHGGYAPVLSVKDEEIPAVVDLSMNSNMSIECAKSGKEVEVIDLDSDVSPEKNKRNRKVESGYEETGERVSMQSNYNGMMLPELLHEVEPLEDDDPIYMSLEEIPLSFVPPWQQPSTEHLDKPF